MPADKYELVALVARYWFAFLGVVIVWRSFIWLRSDAKRKRKRLKQLPDAGLVGEMVVLAGSEALPPGSVIPLPREGTMGSLRSCDVSIPCDGVANRHVDFRFVDGVGLVLTPAPRQELIVDGQEAKPNQQEWVMHHGSRLMIGDALLRMRLFMGLETARSAAFQQDVQELDLTPEMAVVREEWPEEGYIPEDNTPPQPVYMQQPFEPGWEDETRPYHQRMLSWQDTGRYAWDRQMQNQRYQAPYMPNVQAEDFDGSDETQDGQETWLDPYDTDDQEPDDWRQLPPREAPPRRGLFRRGRR